MLDACYALLGLSDALARRAGLPVINKGGGTPAGNLNLPAFTDLKQLGAQIEFSPGDLGELGISRNRLQPFVLLPDHFKIVASRPPGDSPLDFFPLIADGDGVAVISPQAFSTAIRAVLIDTALKFGMERHLLERLFQVQEEFSEEGGFWQLRALRLAPPDRFGIRQSVCC